ncbi:MAG TPA: site-2 protease family protein [Phycisphaerales bacterium]|nr:site-2 protease family protein [Phycisphaerales bacterium]
MLATLFDLLLVLLGFGFIVFIHELGHFLAARWAGVRVLAFAIGFGKAVASYRKGLGWRAGSSEREALAGGFLRPGVSPTEYRFNILPFGGYVRMLGQDDMNPGAVSAASDSYQSAPVWKRMVIISAGVVMNLLLAAVLFIVVMMAGRLVEPAKIGDVEPGSPAAVAAAVNDAAELQGAGLRPGDVVKRIGEREARSFDDLVLATAMAGRGNTLRLEIERESVGEPLVYDVSPRTSKETGLLEIGVGPLRTPRLVTAKSGDEREMVAGALAGSGLPGVEPGMRLTGVNMAPVDGAHRLFEAVRTSDGAPVQVIFEGETGAPVVRTITPRLATMTATLPGAGRAEIAQPHVLGLSGVIRVAQTTAAAEKQGILAGDVVIRAGDVEFPSITEGVKAIRSRAGQRIDVTVMRETDGAWGVVELPGVRVSRSGTIGFGIADSGAELPIVATPLRGSASPPAAPAEAGVTAGSRVVRVNGTETATLNDAVIALRRAAERTPAGRPVSVELGVVRPSGGSYLPAPDAPVETLAWEIPADAAAALRGLAWTTDVSPFLFDLERVEMRAGNPVEALTMGLAETRRVMLTTYLTFARLADGTIKVEHMKGPVGIAHLGTLVAGRGFVWLLFFLALISVNLAVINFLPLPIVDGGQFLMLVYEAVRGRAVPIGVQSAVTMAGLVMIAAVFLFVTYNDVRGLLGF